MQKSKTKAKRKILIFIDWFLPGYKAGGPIRSVANIIDHLSGDFEFYILTSDTDYLENQAYPNIKSNTWTQFSKNVKVYYFSKDRIEKSLQNKSNFKNIVSEIDYDVAYVNGIYSYSFSILPLRILDKSKKTIVVPRGMLSLQAFSAKKLKKKVFVRYAKITSLYKNVIFQATDKKELEDIKSLFSKNKIIEVPNLPRKVKNVNLRKKTKEKGVLKLVSIARISTEKNTLFALSVLEKTSFKGEIIFDIYGSIYNEEYWAECKEIISKLDKNIKINYKGSIESELVTKTFSNYDFAFMPSKGENFGHSIFEAFSAGCPVIISDQTPWRNLEEKNIGWDIDLKNKQKFQETIQKCIDMSDEDYQKMSKNAYKFAEKIANDKSVIEKTRKMFENE